MRSISFVIPVYNEQESLGELHQRIVENIFGHYSKFEIIFVDDGSSDSSWEVIEQICKINRLTTKAIKLGHNQGKAAALKRGFDQVEGDIVFTLDADLQDDPNEIHRFIEKLDEGYDLVSGWKKVRHDPWHKVLPSRVFNKMLSKLVGVELHDHNCGFKCYRKEVVKSLNPYGEMHRMLPSIASMHGYKSTEIVVKHHPRVFGYSKYGVKRFLRGFMDMLTVYFLKNFKERPLHIFGGCSALFLILGVLIQASAFSLVKTMPELSSLGFNIGASLSSMALPLFFLGLLAELIVNSSKQAQDYNEKRLEYSNFNIKPNLVSELRFQLKSQLESNLDSNHESSLESTPVVSEILSSKAQKKALVVDDDPNIRRLITYKLNKMGFEVTQASNGRQALELINPETTLVVLDIMLPEVNGIECLAKFKKSHPNTEVLMVSAQGQVQKAVDAMKLGAADYIAKPFCPSELENAVNSLTSVANLH